MTDWSTKPQLASYADLERLIANNGGLDKNAPLRRLDDPLKHPLDHLQTVVLQMANGQSITVEEDPDRQSVRIVDYGSVGEGFDKQAKASAAADARANQVQLQQLNGKWYRVYGDGSIQPATDIPDAPAKNPIQDQMDAMVEYLKGEVTSKRMTRDQANKILIQTRQAYLTGTTPSAVQQQDWNRQMDRQQLQASKANQRATAIRLLANDFIDQMMAAAKRGVDTSKWGDPYQEAEKMVDKWFGTDQQPQQGQYQYSINNPDPMYADPSVLGENGNLMQGAMGGGPSWFDQSTGGPSGGGPTGGGGPGGGGGYVPPAPSVRDAPIVNQPTNPTEQRNNRRLAMFGM